MFVIIVGGGRTGSHLASLLLMQGHEVRLIDNRPEILTTLHREIPTEVIFEGDGTDPQTLEAAGIQRAQVVAATTADDADNLVVASLARHQYGVRRTIGRINNPKNAWLFSKDFGVDVALNNADIMAKLIEEEMSIGDMMIMLKIRRGKYELVEEKIAPLLEQHSGKRAGAGFGICFQPEFLREGSSIRDYDTPPFTVVGAASDRDAAAVRDVFGHLPCEFKACSVRTAEMLKYACNAFHALKITFANEMGRVCQPLGIDSHDLMDLVCLDTRLNISRAYLRPGFAYGGSCLPKDLAALRHLAGQHDVTIPMLAAVPQSNEAHLDHAIATVLATGKKSVGMIGLSFKSGTDDLRESPLVVMAEHFIGKGLTLRIYDPDVNLSRLTGANRRYIEESIPHLGSLMSDDLSKIAWLIAHSRATLAVIRQNIIAALSVKAVFVALTFAGKASLWAAIAADMGASLLVIGNGLRLLRRASASK